MILKPICNPHDAIRCYHLTDNMEQFSQTVKYLNTSSSGHLLLYNFEYLLQAASPIKLLFLP